MSHVFAGNDTAAGLAGRGDAFYWRLVATAISFTVFGVASLLLSVLVLPLLLLPRQRRQRVARAVVQWGMRRFIGLMRTLGVLTCEFHGAGHLGRGGQIIVANHPTLIDAVFLLAFTPQAVCIAKRSMFRNPLTRGVVAAVGYISNEITVDMIERAAAALTDGQCLIMFPEGTRTRVGMPLVFHRGAANIAVRAARQVTPVYIRCEPLTLTKSEPWYRIPARRPHFSLRVGADIPLEDDRAMRSIPLASRRFNERMRTDFQDELQRPGGYTAAGSEPGAGAE